MKLAPTTYHLAQLGFVLARGRHAAEASKPGSWPDCWRLLETFIEDIAGLSATGEDIVIEVGLAGANDGAVTHTFKEFAKRAGVSPKTISRRVASGDIAAVKIGNGRPRIPASELVRFTSPPAVPSSAAGDAAGSLGIRFVEVQTEGAQHSQGGA